MENINVAVVGCGSRGRNDTMTAIKADKKINIIAICDLNEEFMEKLSDMLVNEGKKKPIKTVDYKEVLKLNEVNTVLVFTSWETHIKIATDAMKAGKAVGMEVGGVENISECYKLVETYEKTKVPFMMLENCCYGKGELLSQNLARSGKLGDIVYCHGAYAHDLRKLMVDNEKRGHYRLTHYVKRNCDNYPTHELGPIAKILDINRGNRMVKLVSVASKSMGLKKYINDNKEDTLEKLHDIEFAQGDIVDTLIVCENGETISIRLDTTLPRFYSREFTVRGTAGLYEGNSNTVYLDGEEENFETSTYIATALNNADRFYYKYLPDYWKNVTKEEIEQGHGGTDIFCFKDFFRCLRERAPMPVDVYDTAAWMAITPLSAESIETGGFVEIPDFTKGAYKTRERYDIK